MNNKIFSMFCFAAGAIIGSAVTYKLIKTKYEQIAEEEIKSVRELYRNKLKEKGVSEPDDSNQDNDSMNGILSDLGYASDNKREKEDDEVESKPYVIPPEEFGNADGYDLISLNYYADGVLTDDWDEVIDDVEGTVGTDSLTHFGEYEDDSVFVRNDFLRTEYEILRDNRNFSDVVPDNDE